MNLPKEAQAVVKKYDEKLCKHLIELVNSKFALTDHEKPYVWDAAQAAYQERIVILNFIEEKGWWYGVRDDRYFLAENKDDRLRRKLREEAQQVGVED